MPNNGPFFTHEEIMQSSLQDKKPRYEQDHKKKIAFTFTNTDNPPPSSTSHTYSADNEMFIEDIGGGVVRKTSTASQREYALNACQNKSEENKNVARLKIGEEFFGFSVDSNVSSFDVFESFDTVSVLSFVSQLSDSERIEKKCHVNNEINTTAVSVKLSHDDADNLRVHNSNEESVLLDNAPFDSSSYYGFIRGSFGDVSPLTKPRNHQQFRTYGIRDLKSETNLSDLKEHILCAEQNKGPRALTPNRRFSAFAQQRGQLLTVTPPRGDLLLSLSSGYISYERFHERKYCSNNKNHSKIFSSLQNIDSNTMALSYIDSVKFLKQKDAEACRASGPGLKDGIAGEKTTFYIFTDKDNLRMLKVYITGPRLTPPNIEFSCLVEGFYSVSYLPDRVGWYYVNVLWKGRHVPGSPFHVLMLLPKRKVWIKHSDLTKSIKTSKCIC
eukprot:gene3183-3653_t